MAKSLRSRWKRKCRAVKRERYAVKELARLKKMLGIKPEEGEKSTTEEVMESDQVIFLDAGAIKKQNKAKEKAVEAAQDEDVEMSSDDEQKVTVEGEDGKKRVYSTKSLKDQNGQYPVWLHKRKIAKMNRVPGKKSTKKRSSKKRKRTK